MAEKKNDSGFTVTDRRLVYDGRRTEVGYCRKKSKLPKQTAPPAPMSKDAGAARPGAELADADATVGTRYAYSAHERGAGGAGRGLSAIVKDLDKEVELSGHSAKDFEITFERFLAAALHDGDAATGPDAPARTSSRVSTSLARA